MIVDIVVKMVKSRVNCLQCNKLFWAKAKKDKLTRKVYVDILNQYCQECKNRMRRMGMKRKPRLREIPEEFNSQITLRELYQAEGKRRQEEKKAEQTRNKLVKKK